MRRNRNGFMRRNRSCDTDWLQRCGCLTTDCIHYSHKSSVKFCSSFWIACLLLAILIYSLCFKSFVHQLKLPVSANPVERKWRWSMWTIMEGGYLLWLTGYRNVSFILCICSHLIWHWCWLMLHSFLSETYLASGSVDRSDTSSQVWHR